MADGSDVIGRVHFPLRGNSRLFNLATGGQRMSIGILLGAVMRIV